MTPFGIPEETLPMLEMPCPEYFVTEIGRIEPAGRDNLRFYCCARRGKQLEPLYMAIIPIEDLVRMAQLCMRAAQDHHNQLMMMDAPRIAH